MTSANHNRSARGPLWSFSPDSPSFVPSHLSSMSSSTPTDDGRLWSVPDRDEEYTDVLLETTRAYNELMRVTDQMRVKQRGRWKNPVLYKTTLCDYWRENGECRFGSRCWYAHGMDEIRHVPRLDAIPGFGQIFCKDSPNTTAMIGNAAQKNAAIIFAAASRTANNPVVARDLQTASKRLEQGCKSERMANASFFMPSSPMSCKPKPFNNTFDGQMGDSLLDDYPPNNVFEKSIANMLNESLTGRTGSSSGSMGSSGNHRVSPSNLFRHDSHKADAISSGYSSHSPCNSSRDVSPPLLSRPKDLTPRAAYKRLESSSSESAGEMAHSMKSVYSLFNSNPPPVYNFSGDKLCGDLISRTPSASSSSPSSGQR